MEDVEKIFGKPPSAEVNPDEVVAGHRGLGPACRTGRSAFTRGSVAATRSRTDLTPNSVPAGSTLHLF